MLRRFGVQDMAALHLLLADEEVNTFLPWFPSKSMEDTRRFYEQRLAEGKYCFAVCLKGREEPAGYIKADENGCHDFGYALRKEFWHRGFATDVYKRQVLHAAFCGFARLRRGGAAFRQRRTAARRGL